jgi:hypothetical protein
MSYRGKPICVCDDLVCKCQQSSVCAGRSWFAGHRVLHMVTPKVVRLHRMPKGVAEPEVRRTGEK